MAGSAQSGSCFFLSAIHFLRLLSISDTFPGEPAKVYLLIL